MGPVYVSILLTCVFLLVGKIFFNDFVEYVFCAFELVFFSFFYPYYSKMTLMKGKLVKLLPISCFRILHREILMNITRGKLKEQESITIARHYREPEIVAPDTTYLIAQAHEKFKKNMFENFNTFVCNCVYEDKEKKGVLPTKDIKRMCKSFRLPLSDDFLDNLLSRNVKKMFGWNAITDSCKIH
ncbi:hypothetical protein STEG23_008850 [Scotinomys teguina]